MIKLIELINYYLSQCDEEVDGDIIETYEFVRDSLIPEAAALEVSNIDVQIAALEGEILLGEDNSGEEWKRV